MATQLPTSEFKTSNEPAKEFPKTSLTPLPSLSIGQEESMSGVYEQGAQPTAPSLPSGPEESTSDVHEQGAQTIAPSLSIGQEESMSGVYEQGAQPTVPSFPIGQEESMSDIHEQAAQQFAKAAQTPLPSLSTETAHEQKPLSDVHEQGAQTTAPSLSIGQEGSSLGQQSSATTETQGQEMTSDINEQGAQPTASSLSFGQEESMSDVHEQVAQQFAKAAQTPLPSLSTETAHEQESMSDVHEQGAQTTAPSLSIGQEMSDAGQQNNTYTESAHGQETTSDVHEQRGQPTAPSLSIGQETPSIEISTMQQPSEGQADEPTHQETKLEEHGTEYRPGEEHADIVAEESKVEQRGAEEAVQPHSYMVAMDGSLEAGSAFKWLFKQLQRQTASHREQVQVKIVHLLPSVSEQVSTTEAFQSAKQEIQEGLDQFAKILVPLKVEHEVQILEGAEDVGTFLCAKVAQEKIDTLVLGNTGKSLLMRFAIGSVSDYCLRNAQCAVVVVK